MLQIRVQKIEERKLFRLCTTFCFLINNARHVAERKMWAIHWNEYLSNDEWAVTSNCSTVLRSIILFTASYHQSARSYWAWSKVNSRGGTKPWLIQKCSWSFYVSFHNTRYLFMAILVIKDFSTPFHSTSISYNILQLFMHSNV